MSEDKKKLDDFFDALQQYRVPAEPPQEMVDNLLQRLAPKEDTQGSSVLEPKVSLAERIKNLKLVTKLVTAAIIILAVCVAVALIYNQKEPKEQITNRQAVKIESPNFPAESLPADTKKKLQDELNSVTNMYAAGDVKGLLAILDSEPYETKIAIAYFLGEIGDMPAAEAIEKYSSLWKGNSRDNPFIKSAAKIRARLQPKPAPAPEIEEDVNDMNEPSAQEPNIAKKVKVTEPIDSNKLLMEGMTCRLFDLNEKAVDGIIFINKVTLNVSQNGGIYWDKNLTDVLQQMRHGSSLCAAYDRDKKYAQSFVWLADSNSYDIYLEPVSDVTGIIVCKDQIDFKKIEIEPQILFPNEASASVLTKWNIDLDDKGQFKISNVPPGMPLRIIIMLEGLQAEAELDRIEPGQNINVGRVFLEPLPGFENSLADWTGKLSGFIVNENNEPVSRANLFVNIGNKSFHATSDSRGSYQIEGLPFGKTVEVSVIAGGYDTNDITIVVDNKENYIKVYPKGYELLNKKAPSLFVERWLNCQPITLQDFLGKIVLFEYGDVREPYLDEYIQNLIKLTYRYGGVLQPIFVQYKGDWNGKKFNMEEIIQYIQHNNIFFPFGLEGNLSDISDKTLPVYKMGKAGEMGFSVPQLYLIDKKGIIRACPTMNNLQEWIEKLLAEE